MNDQRQAAELYQSLQATQGGEPTTPPQLVIVVDPDYRPPMRLRDGLALLATLLCSVLFYPAAIWCALNGYGWQFVAGAGLLATALVLWVKWPQVKR